MDCLTGEQFEDLYREFPYIQQTKAVAWEDLKRASEVVGVPLAGHELRDILGLARSSISLEEFEVMYSKAKEMKDLSKELRQGMALKRVDDIKVSLTLQKLTFLNNRMVYN